MVQLLVEEETAVRSEEFDLARGVVAEYSSFALGRQRGESLVAALPFRTSLDGRVGRGALATTWPPSWRRSARSSRGSPGTSAPSSTLTSTGGTPIDEHSWEYVDPGVVPIRGPNKLVEQSLKAPEGKLGQQVAGQGWNFGFPVRDTSVVEHDGDEQGLPKRLLEQGFKATLPTNSPVSRIILRIGPTRSKG